jgi:hypothetical protein
LNIGGAEALSPNNVFGGVDDSVIVKVTRGAARRSEIGASNVQRGERIGATKTRAPNDVIGGIDGTVAIKVVRQAGRNEWE